MSVWSDLKHNLKKGALFVWGPAQLDPRVDPNVKLDKEHENESPPDPRRGKDWDRG